MQSIEALREASRTGDVPLLRSALDDRVEFRAPALARLVFRGSHDVSLVLSTAFGIFDDVTSRAELAEGTTHVVILDCRFAIFALTDALVIEVGDDGLIVSLEPHLRPWPSSTLFILLMATRLCRRPRVLLRALRRGAPAGAGSPATTRFG